MVRLMKMQMNKRVANLPAVARCGGNKKRLICMSLRAPTTIATSFIKIRKNRSYKILSKLVAMVAMVEQVAVDLVVMILRTKATIMKLEGGQTMKIKMMRILTTILFK